jgi:hypothetical protein
VPLKLLTEELRHTATMRLARVGLALLEFRQEYGRWPDSLAELAPRFAGSVPLDPYAQEPFRYERVGDGTRIEAAAPIPLEELREEYEIAWELRP